MAGDWIKWRTELLTHPRFMSLCGILIYGENPGMLIYACGDALGIGAYPPSDETVTTRALRCVTEDALRCVTMCALLRVWSAVNAHCKIQNNDAVMAPMTLLDIDGIAGFDDFAEALSQVGWVSVGGDNSLIFPNFLDFNEPACLRRPSMTNAERQKAYRMRLESVTPRYVRYAREEKSREEKSRKKNSPVSPLRGTAFPAEFIASDEIREIAAALSLDVAAEWNRFRDYCADKGTVSKNWEARARNWFRKAGEFKQQSASSPLRAHRDFDSRTGLPHHYRCPDCGEPHVAPFGQPRVCTAAVKAER